MSFPRAPDTIRFTEAQIKFIAEFYVQHFDIMRTDQPYETGLNKKRSQFFAEMTKALNTKWNKRFTQQQVHRKLKHMKRDARLLLVEVDNGLRSINGEDGPDVPLMSEAEALLVQKMIAMRSSMASRQRPPSSDPLITVPCRGGVDVDDSDDEEDAGFEDEDEDFLAARTVQREGNARKSIGQPLVVPTIQPGGLQTLIPVRNGTAYSRIGQRPPWPWCNAQKRKAPPPSTSRPTVDPAVLAMKRQALHVQKEALEQEMALLGDKKESLGKFMLAVDEFRRYVAEQRLTTRGVDISNIPIDIPPGMQGIAME